MVTRGTKWGNSFKVEDFGRGKRSGSTAKGYYMDKANKAYLPESKPNATSRATTSPAGAQR